MAPRSRLIALGRRRLAALVVCASLAGLCSPAEAASTGLPNVTNGDVYKCVFPGLLVVPAPNIPGLLNDPFAAKSGSFSMSGTATCVFADVYAPGTSTTFNAQISSHGRFSGTCEALQLTGESNYGATVISGGPEGSITGSGSELYDIAISERAGVIDFFKGLGEPDGDAIKGAHVAGAVLVAEALGTPFTGCIGSAGALVLTGSFQMTT
jgi:hypothetical protein